MCDPSPEVQQWARESLQKSKATAEAPASQPDLADVAGVPVQDLRAGGDVNRRYFLVGPAKAPQAPPEGLRLLIVLPGGDGGADARFFVRRIHKNVLDKRWLIAQAVGSSESRNRFGGKGPTLGSTNHKKKRPSRVSVRAVRPQIHERQEKKDLTM